MELEMEPDGEEGPRRVCLENGDRVGFDGSAWVKLLSGRASIMGYCLPLDTDFLICCNSQLSGMLLPIQFCPDRKCSRPSGVPDAVNGVAKCAQQAPIVGKGSETAVLEIRPYYLQSSKEQRVSAGYCLEVQPATSEQPGTEREKPVFMKDSRNCVRFEGEGELLEASSAGTHAGGNKRARNGGERDGASTPLVGGSRKRKGSGSGEEQQSPMLKIKQRGVSSPASEGRTELEDIIAAYNQMEDSGGNAGVERTANGAETSQGTGAKEMESARASVPMADLPKSWWVAANRIATTGARSQPAPIVAVVGLRNVGKSTFSQFLINRMLGRYKRVCYLETDVGQPEFTPPGMVSLHVLDAPVFGAPCLHMRKPEHAFLFGDTSPKSDPEGYVWCVRALYDIYQRQFHTGSLEDVPLVVNTHGWVRGLGYEVLVDMLRYMLPRHVVQLVVPASFKNLPHGAFWSAPGESVTTELHHVDPGAAVEDSSIVAPHRNAGDVRSLRFLSYLRPCLSGGAESLWQLPLNENATFASAAEALVRQRPYKVPLAAVHIIHLHCQVPRSEQLRAINGAVVGLCTSGSGEAAHPRAPPCLGLGIVRSVDPREGVLYILTPLDAQDLQKVDTLVHSRLELPLALLQASLRSPYLCQSAIAQEGTGSMAIKSRSNILRKSLDVA